LAVVDLIGPTTTNTGLKVESALDTRSYSKGITVTKKASDIDANQVLWGSAGVASSSLNR
jgi:hypothetical protein